MVAANISKGTYNHKNTEGLSAMSRFTRFSLSDNTLGMKCAITSLLPILRNDKIPLRVRKKLGKLIGSPAPDRPFHIKVFGAAYEGKTGNHQDDKIYSYGSHEAATLRAMRDILAYQKSKGQKPVYLDIGTNVGQHLIAVAGNATAAFGFEPWGKVRAIAQHNLDINGFGHVKIMPYGLSDADAQLPYFPPEGGNLGVGSFAVANDSATVTLEVRKGDTALAEFNIAPTLLKIDTEGFEAHVLRGLKETIEKYRPAIVFELSEQTRKDFPSLEVMRAFFPKGYSFHGICRSREMPKILPYSPNKRFENLLAWPEEVFPL